jgi:hypothetical protein
VSEQDDFARGDQRWLDEVDLPSKIVQSPPTRSGRAPELSSARSMLRST